MYCIKCGVELADSEIFCPLCQTKVYHPEINIENSEGPYPINNLRTRKTVNVRGLLFLITVCMAALSCVLLLCDLKISGTVVWSGYSVGGLLLLYEAVVLPAWFKRPNPVIFVPVWFACAIAFLLYVNLSVGGGWFMSFAFPTAGTIGLIVTAAVTLYKYLKRGYLYITGGLILALGFSTVLIEFLIRITFKVGQGIPWSVYPVTVGFFVGMSLIVIAICKPLRLTLQKKLFI